MGWYTIIETRDRVCSLKVMFNCLYDLECFREVSVYSLVVRDFLDYINKDI